MLNDATAAPPPPPRPGANPQPIAPWWHTAGLFALLLLSTFLTHHEATRGLVAPRARIPSYLGSIALEWMLFGLVIAGVYRRRDFLRGAMRNHITSLLESLGTGIAVYVAGLLAIAFVGSVIFLTHLLPRPDQAVILALTPHTPPEFLVWFGVSLTAGITEELIFRGYLIQQLTAWTRRPIASIFLAALLFGSVHLYEGVAAILPLAALAILYGYVVRYFRGDLRAVIVAHTLQDFLVAFIVLARPWLEQHQPKT